MVEDRREVSITNDLQNWVGASNSDRCHALTIRNAVPPLNKIKGNVNNF